MHRAEEIRAEAKIEAVVPLAMKVAVPLLQAAVTLEDDNSLQDRWARFLVNATNPDRELDPLTAPIVNQRDL
ncbi:Abi-alpha family protein [Cupriavidus sp. USMAHM13]|uniref:Abi-alpha family protein n=1 Tax=Cupriavidus sp. USMAHM13 TaxID=1389192 RepID=UPI003FA4AD7D